MNAGQHFGNTKEILLSLDWLPKNSEFIKAFQVLNWITDYIALVSAFGKKANLMGLIDYVPFPLPYVGLPSFSFFKYKKVIFNLAKNNIIMYNKKGYDCFHFDNLETIDEIINHWQYLETCLKKYLVEIRKNSFPDNEFQIKLLMLISLLAQTLHAVQDFYCHTNWVEILHEKNSYEKTSDFPTWFDLIEKDQNLKKELSTLQSGYFPIGKDNKKHLIYHNDRKRKNLPGLNKDRADRPYFEIVYSLAKRHGVQWLNYIKTNFLTTEELNLLNKPLSIPFANEINKIHDYGYSIAYKLKEWNGSRPFNNLCLKINDAQVKGSKLKLDLIVTTTDKLIKYDRDFRKAYIIIELIINGYKQRYFKFCNKNGSVKVIIEMKTNNLQKEVHQLIIQVKYGLLKTSKLIIGEY